MRLFCLISSSFPYSGLPRRLLWEMFCQDVCFRIICVALWVCEGCRSKKNVSQKMEKGGVYYGLYSCTVGFYCIGRSFFGVSGAELSQIVFISELSALYSGLLGSGTECHYTQGAVKLVGRCKVLLGEKCCSHVRLEFSIETQIINDQGSFKALVVDKGQHQVRNTGSLLQCDLVMYPL